MVHARIERLVYAASDPRTGAAGSVFDLACNDALNHRMEVIGGVLANESAALLQAFFRASLGAHIPAGSAGLVRRFFKQHF